MIEGMRERVRKGVGEGVCERSREGAGEGESVGRREREREIRRMRNKEREGGRELREVGQEEQVSNSIPCHSC